MPGFGQMTELEKKRVTVSEGYSSCDSADDMDRHVADDKRRPRAKVGYFLYTQSRWPKRLVAHREHFIDWTSVQLSPYLPAFPP